jgi:RecA/RadA recombinase
VSPSPPKALEGGCGPISRPQRQPARPIRSSDASSAAVEALLRDLGPELLRASCVRARSEAPARLASGIPEIDAVLGGGFPRGRLSEIAGPVSSGRTSVMLALLARATRAGEVVAVVDAADAFDPASAAAAGVALERTLWVRPAATQRAVRCSQRLLETHGFALVALDLARADSGANAGGAEPTLPESVWQRLAHTAAATGTALLLLSDARQAGTRAEVALQMQSLRAHFAGTPPLLESLEIQAVVARQRAGPVQCAASARLGTRPRAA